MRAELGDDWDEALRLLRARAGGRGLARAGAPRDRRQTAERSPASCNTRTWIRPWRPTSRQLGIILAMQRRFSPEIDTREVMKELGERLREELDYAREARHMRLYGAILADAPDVRVPEVLAGAFDAPAPHA